MVGADRDHRSMAVVRSWSAPSLVHSQVVATIDLAGSVNAASTAALRISAASPTRVEIHR